MQRTWLDLDDDEVVWEEIEEAIPSAKATEQDMETFQITGQVS